MLFAWRHLWPSFYVDVKTTNRSEKIIFIHVLSLHFDYRTVRRWEWQQNELSLNTVVTSLKPGYWVMHLGLFTSTSTQRRFENRPESMVKRYENVGLMQNYLIINRQNSDKFDMTKLLFFVRLPSQLVPVSGPLTRWCASTFGAGLLWSSRVGSWFGANIK